MRQAYGPEMGPFPARKLAAYVRRGSISAETRVASPEWKDWKALQDVAELEYMLLDTATSLKASWLWYPCPQSTQLQFQDWDAINLIRTCAGLAVGTDAPGAAGYEAIERCRDWYERVDLLSRTNPDTVRWLRIRQLQVHPCRRLSQRTFESN